MTEAQQLEQIKRIFLDYELKRDPKLKPVDKEYSDRVLGKIKAGSGSLDRHLLRLLDRYLIFPAGETEGRCAYNYFHKPNENTELSFIGGELVIFDLTFCEVEGEKIRVIDKRYQDFNTVYSLPKDPDHDHLFRGMRGEEFLNMVARGYINSDKSQSLSFQKNITCFTPFLWLALGYAYNSKSVRRDSPVFGRPSYVVKVKRKGLKYKLEAGSEAWVQGDVPISKIVQIYEIRLGLATAGRFDWIEETQRPRYRYMETMIGIREFSETEIKEIRRGPGAMVGASKSMSAKSC